MSDHDNGSAFYARHSLRDRVLARLFPMAPRPRPSDDDARTYLTTVVRVHLDLVDRLRVLLTGRLTIETITLTEAEVKGDVESRSAVSAGV